MAKPRSQLAEAIDAPYHEYWGALGRFIHEFSRVEHFMQLLVREAAGVSPEIGGAIFTDNRSGSGKDTINRCLTARGLDDAKQRLVDPFKQLGDILAIRNHIVHWGATHDGQDALLVTNANLSVSADRLKEFRVSPRDLEAMSLDLFKIGMHLILEIRFLRERSDPDDPRWREALEEPWLYKPPQQSAQKKGATPAPSKARRSPRTSSDR